MSYFPLFLDIASVNFLVIGAGNIALAKLETLVEFGCKVKIVSLNAIEQVSQMASDNDIELIKDSYDKKYLKEIDIVIAATNDNQINSKIYEDAKKLGILVNIVDDPKNCDFIFGSNIKYDNIIISSGTSGMSPVLARLLKNKIRLALPKNLDLFNEFITKNRDKVRSILTNLQSRRIFWQEIIEGVIGQEIEFGNLNRAQELFDAKIKNQENENKAFVYFISAGPGDPELITLKAIKLLSKADIVLYDRLVSDEILQYARKDAIKINVGKKKDFHRYKQDEINELIKEYAKKGNIVARLKGGDSALFARLSEEIAATKEVNVKYQIVPGVTSASAASAYSGIPLTSRNSNKSVRFLTLYEKDLVNDEYWKNIASGEDSLVFYMSSHNLSIIAKNLAKFGKNITTKIAIIEQASTPYQKTYITDIANFDKDYGEKKFTSPSIVIIGDVVCYHENFKWKEENLVGEYFSNLKKRENAG